MMKFNHFGYFLVMALILTSCEEDCNDIYKTHGVRVEGLNLQEVFTIRVRTGDTLYRTMNVSQDTTFFTVAEDNLLDELKNEGENFNFTIIAQDSLKMEHNFVFRPGDCHVEKVSGPTKISF